jgi:hypothetical protein
MPPSCRPGGPSVIRALSTRQARRCPGPADPAVLIEYHACLQSVLLRPIPPQPIFLSNHPPSCAVGMSQGSPNYTPDLHHVQPRLQQGGVSPQGVARSPGRAGELVSASTGRTGRSQATTHYYGGPTAAAADQAGPDDSGRVISPAPEWDAGCDVGPVTNMTGSEPGRRLSVGTYRRNRPLNVRGHACVTATIYSVRL